MSRFSIPVSRAALWIAGAVIVAGGIGTFLFHFRDSSPDRDPLNALERPSPLLMEDPALIPNRRPAEQATRSRAGSVPKPAEAPVETDESPEWGVIAATYKSYDAARRRAAALRSQWAECDCDVYPREGQGEKYYVLVGANLSHAEAERLHLRARQSGLPEDTYVTKVGVGER